MRSPDVVEIVGETALADFRRGLNARAILDLLSQHAGRLLIRLAIGVGKSHLIDRLAAAALAGGLYGLVVVLCATRRLIAERRRPPGVKAVTLNPRPARRCGPERDARWKAFEAADLGALGRAEVCGACPHRKRCAWPDQYGAGLEGAQVIYATQAHLARAPDFALMLRDRAGAAPDRMLVLLDEAEALARPAGVTVAPDELRRLAEAVEHAGPAGDPDGRLRRRWTELLRLLAEATTEDLQSDAWRFPRIVADWALAVQRAGVQRFGEAFSFPAYRLAGLATAPVESRHQADDGSIAYARRLAAGGDLILFTATADPELIAHRLGERLASPFAGHRFRHPETRWFNLASAIGTRSYFPRHAEAILDFFAALIARRAAEGRRVLTVAKKCFLSGCAAALQRRLDDLGAGLRVVADGLDERDLADPSVIPLINYGAIGTNLYEGYDCAYCLTSYYTDLAAVDGVLQDLRRDDLRVPLRIETLGQPRRRRAAVADPEHRFTDVAQLAQAALQLKEHDVVLQAVGRVRPFTRPREVITLQQAELPGVTYEAEFTSLAEARRYFGVPTRRQRRVTDRAAQVAALRAAGMTQAEVAEMIGVTERTVRNYDAKGHRK